VFGAATVANVGHSTDLKKAVDKPYSPLPGCCKYDRPATTYEMDKKAHGDKYGGKVLLFGAGLCPVAFYSSFSGQIIKLG